MLRASIALLIAVTLGGCAGLNIRRPVSEDDLKASRRIGVASILGDTFHVVSIGTTVFNNTYSSGPVNDWGIDTYASGAALELLRKNAGFASALVEGTSRPTEQERAEGGKLLLQAAAKQGFDRLVVLEPRVSDNFPFFRPGFGYFERSFLGSSRRCVYAAYVVSVYDVATRKPIAWEWGGREPCEIGRDNDLTVKPRFSDNSNAEKAMMRRRLEARIAESLRYSLKSLSLVPSSAAPQ